MEEIENKCLNLISKIDLVVHKMDSDGWSEVEMEQGTAKGKLLISVPDIVTVAYSIASEDAIFKTHAHEQAECIIVCSDHTLTVNINGKELKVIKATPFCVRPGIKHRVSCHGEGECHFVAVTIPNNPAWTPVEK